MVEFLVHSDILLYKAKLEQIIYNYMKSKKYNYVINMNNFSMCKDNSLKIFIIDLESDNSINWIYKANKVLKTNIIICFTYDLKKANILLQHNLKYNQLISKKTIDYEKQFEALFDKYFNGELYNVGKVIEYDNYKIPTCEVNSISTLSNRVIIKATTPTNEEYIYNININFNDIKKQLNEKFLILNDYFITNKKTDININMNLKLTNKVSKHKVYPINLKKKIITLHEQGMSIKELSQSYEPSYTTIYNWVRLSKYEKNIKQMEIKVKKYDDISNIVKSGEEV